MITLYMYSSFCLQLFSLDLQSKYSLVKVSMVLIYLPKPFALSHIIHFCVYCVYLRCKSNTHIIYMHTHTSVLFSLNFCICEIVLGVRLILNNLLKCVFLPYHFISQAHFLFFPLFHQPPLLQVTKLLIIWLILSEFFCANG